MNKTIMKSVALAVVVVWGLNQFKPTQRLMNGQKSYF